LGINVLIFILQAWSAPLQILVAIVLLYLYLGWAAFAALGMVLIIIPASFAVAGYGFYLFFLVRPLLGEY
jgi:hypothetical protein